MLASDLQGLGVNPLQAYRTANAGTGPLTIASLGSTFATANRVDGAQYLVTCSDSDGTKALSLPPIGGDGGALIGDCFTINNQGSTTFTIFCSTGVTISVSGSNTSSTTLGIHTSLTAYPLSTSQWIGIKGA